MTEELLRPDEVGRLLEALRDPFVEVRVTAAEALVRLPLSEDTWRETADYFQHVLDPRSESPHAEKRAVTDAAARVPVRSVRVLLWNLAGGNDPILRGLAAEALARAGDNRAILPLLQELSGAAETRAVAVAKHLSLLDVTSYRNDVGAAYQVEVASGRAGGATRFWLSIALARAADPVALLDTVDAYERGEIPLWFTQGDPELVIGQVAMGGPLPGHVVDVLRNPEPIPHLLALVIEGSERAVISRRGEQVPSAGERVRQAPSKTERPPQVEDDVRRVIDLMNEGFVSGEGEEDWITSDRILAVWEETLEPHAITVLFDQAAKAVGTIQGTILGNSIVEVVSEIEPEFDPDVSGLLGVYGGLEPAERGLRAQVAWTAGRGGLHHVIRAATDALAAPDVESRRVAANLIRDAAEFVADPWPPIFGGEPAAAPPPRIASFIEDILEAKSRGPKAEPPEREEVGADRPQREVRTGFALQHEPDDGLPANRTLRTSTDYWYWLEISEEAVAGELEHTPIDLSHLPLQAILDVVLFSLDGKIKVRASSGRLRLDRDGDVVVDRQPSPRAGPVRAALRRGVRLLFPIRTPRTEGQYSLRAGIYYKQALIQSRRIWVAVRKSAREMDDALSIIVDYSFSRSLTWSTVAARQEHRLNLMVNDNGDGSHGFLFVGDDGKPFRCAARIPEGNISDAVEQARAQLRRAAYGDTGEWKEGMKYEYPDGKLDIERLREDLVAIAIAGARIHGKIVEQFACAGRNDVPKDIPEAIDRLESLMRTPGLVEVTTKVDPTLTLPAAVLYDHRLSDAHPERVQLCKEFESALKDGADLERHECFKGNCPNQREFNVMCPSGFWGYRHYLGVPASLSILNDRSNEGDEDAYEGTPFIPCVGAALFHVSISTDKAFTLRDGHLQALVQELPGIQWMPTAETKQATIDLFRSSEPNVIYFYCHGGLSPTNAPFLGLGDPDAGDWLTELEIRTMGFRWKNTRPLILINGCHTTAMSPNQALDFVSAFLQRTYASGVVGTETTIFEPLATAFAEELFGRFVRENQALGRAVRGARLALLSKGNPLGLVYVPFAVPDLVLKRGDRLAAPTNVG